jgi:lauroyl/myristoyl acyltransferase
MDVAEFKDGSASPEQAASAVNRAVEDMVRYAPGQYLWAYDRDKQPRAES